MPPVPAEALPLLCALALIAHRLLPRRLRPPGDPATHRLLPPFCRCGMPPPEVILPRAVFFPPPGCGPQGGENPAASPYGTSPSARQVTACIPARVFPSSARQAMHRPRSSCKAGSTSGVVTARRSCGRHRHPPSRRAGSLFYHSFGIPKPHPRAAAAKTKKDPSPRGRILIFILSVQQFCAAD